VRWHFRIHRWQEILRLVVILLSCINYCCSSDCRTHGTQRGRENCRRHSRGNVLEASNETEPTETEDSVSSGLMAWGQDVDLAIWDRRCLSHSASRYLMQVVSRVYRRNPDSIVRADPATFSISSLAGVARYDSGCRWMMLNIAYKTRP